jgi:hypothetical protein
MAPRGPREMRETALRRLLHAKRWILAVSLALTGALTGLAANAFPGKTIKAPASGATSEQGTSESSSSTGTSTEGSSGSLSPPEQSPQGAEPGASSGEQGASQPTPEAPVVSGGS